MKRIYCFTAVLLICLISFPAGAVAAVATPSDAQENPVYGYIDELLKEIDYDDLDDYEKLNLLDLYISSLSGPGVASGSDADLSDIRQYLADIRNVIVPPEAEETEEESLLVDEQSVPALYDAGGFNIDRNVVIYVGRWNGQSARLVLPAVTEATLWKDPDSGALYNVGTSNIVGRIFYGDADLTDYNQYVFTMTPALNGNASTLYNDGYPNYCRRYYVSGGRVTYTTTYGNFIVTEVVNTPSDVQEDVNGLYLLVLILIGGVQILCFWKKSRNW